MEYIEGETLADRLKKGALPLDLALRHGIEIADDDLADYDPDLGIQLPLSQSHPGIDDRSP